MEILKDNNYYSILRNEDKELLHNIINDPTRSLSLVPKEEKKRHMKYSEEDKKREIKDISTKELLNRSKKFSLKYPVRDTYLYYAYISKLSRGAKEKDINLDDLEKECKEKIIKGEI